MKISVEPNKLSAGVVILVRTSPTTPPDEKYQRSSKLVSANAQLVKNKMSSPRIRVPIIIRSNSASPSSSFFLKAIHVQLIMMTGNKYAKEPNEKNKVSPIQAPNAPPAFSTLPAHAV